jgi:hypothetical protein
MPFERPVYGTLLILERWPFIGRRQSIQNRDDDFCRPRAGLPTSARMRNVIMASLPQGNAALRLRDLAPLQRGFFSSVP